MSCKLPRPDLGLDERKHFFLKKEAKTFAVFARALPHCAHQTAKVFWFFFSEKNGLPPSQ
jgi:hypothetical protein